MKYFVYRILPFSRDKENGLCRIWYLDIRLYSECQHQSELVTSHTWHNNDELMTWQDMRCQTTRLCFGWLLYFITRPGQGKGGSWTHFQNTPSYISGKEVNKDIVIGEILLIIYIVEIILVGSHSNGPGHQSSLTIGVIFLSQICFPPGLTCDHPSQCLETLLTSSLAPGEIE